jgi:hypothetical protein
MYEVQAVTPQTNNWKTRIWSALVGFAVGLAVASGVFWILMREQQRRHEAELVALGVAAGTPAAMFDTVRGILGGGEAAAARNETTPTKDEIAAYLDGKTLSLPEADRLTLNQGETSTKSCVMKKDGIEAVEKGSGAYRIGDDPWSTPLTLLYKAGDAHYAVDMTIQHKPLGGKSAFYGFSVTRVAKQ